MQKIISQFKSAIYRRFFQKDYTKLAAQRNIIALNYVYWIYNDPALKTHQPLVIDCGTGYTADCSIALIEQFNAKSYGIDPTEKHTAQLDAVAAKYPGHFTRLKYAVSDQPGTVTFYETAENESSSMLQDHINVKADTITPYQVEAITLEALFKKLNIETLDILKIDIEGMECKVLDNAPDAVLLKAKQLIVEFHHTTVDSMTEADVQHTIARMSKLGYQNFTSDFINYTFYRP